MRYVTVDDVIRYDYVRYCPAWQPAFQIMQDSLSAEEKDAIRAELERILASSSFAPSARLREFLKFVVEKTLQGAALKESLVGVGVFGKVPGWDSQRESVVRTTANRLRQLLARYYRTEGCDDPILIVLDKGSYVPRFSLPIRPEPVAAQSGGPVNNPSEPAAELRNGRHPLLVAAILTLVAACCVEAWLGVYGIAILALSVGAVLALLAFAQSSDTALARLGISLFMLAVMAYIPSASTLPMLEDSVGTCQRSQPQSSTRSLRG